MLSTAFLAVGGLGVAGVAVCAPQAIKWREINKLRRLCRRTASLALTYDDGPGSTLTPLILELLNGSDAVATFFPTGRSAKAEPALLDEIVLAGHAIGCHSDTHLHAWKTYPRTLRRDIRRGYDSLKPWVPGNGLYRPPYGKFTLPVWQELRERAAKAAWWTIDSGDTWKVLPNPTRIVRNVALNGGGVVLMHDFDRLTNDANERHDYVLELSRLLIDYARNAPLRLCSYSQLTPRSVSQRQSKFTA